MKKYEELLLPSQKAAIKFQIKSGLAFGLSQFCELFVFAAMFWSGGKLIQDNIDPVTGEMNIDPARIFLALLCIEFGASHMG